MALPVIAINSATGSDTAASGAGPSTALTGTTNASTSGTGLVVTLPNGTDLSGVSTTGSDVIFLNDSTAGARNFGKITATAGSGGATPTVTVSNAFGLSLASKSWAIGGKRASIGSTTSIKLFDNNSASGDAMPGWVVEMQSGHAETLSSGVNFRRAGDATSGPIILRGVSGAATRPVLTMGAAFIPRTQYLTFRDFDCLDTSGHSVSVFNMGAGVGNTIIDGVNANHATSYPSSFVSGASSSIRVSRCKVLSSTTCIALSGSFTATVEDCDLKSTGGKGIDATGMQPLGLVFVRNVIHGCGGHGIVLDLQTGNVNRSARIAGNTVDSCGSGFDGIRVLGVGDDAGNVTIVDNVLSNNGGYGLYFSDASMTDAALAGYGVRVANNDTYLNTSGAYKSATASYAYNACPWATGDPGANPTYASGSDFTPTNAALQAGTSVAGY